jgi:hypothetical protein
MLPIWNQPHFLNGILPGGYGGGSDNAQQQGKANVARDWSNVKSIDWIHGRREMMDAGQ